MPSRPSWLVRPSSPVSARTTIRSITAPAWFAPRSTSTHVKSGGLDGIRPIWRRPGKSGLGLLSMGRLSDCLLRLGVVHEGGKLWPLPRRADEGLHRLAGSVGAAGDPEHSARVRPLRAGCHQWTGSLGFLFPTPSEEPGLPQCASPI